jgi:hypothetical protein
MTPVGERVVLYDASGNIINPSSGENQTELLTRFGEVQPTPTADTLLRRIKDLLTGISLAEGANVIGSNRIADPDNSSRLAAFDPIKKVILVQQTEHGHNHEGVSYERHIDSNNLPVTSLNVAFKTLSGTKLAHMLFGWASNDEIKFEIIEGASWTQGTGSLLDVINTNRDSSNTSVVILEDQGQPTFTATNKVIKDVTGIVGGTVIDPQFTYNAALGVSVIAETRFALHEWILKNNETYIVRLTQTDGDCKMSINLHWYEHTNE